MMPILLFNFKSAPRKIVNRGDIYIEGDVPDGAKLLNYDGDIIVEGEIQSGAEVSLIATGAERTYKIDAARICQGAEVRQITAKNSCGT